MSTPAHDSQRRRAQGAPLGHTTKHPPTQPSSQSHEETRNRAQRPTYGLHGARPWVRLWARLGRRWSVRQRLSAMAALAAMTGLAVASVVAYVIVDRSIRYEVDLSFQASPVAARDGVLSLPPPGPLCNNSTSDLPSLGLYSSQLVRADGTLCPATGDALVLPDDLSTLGAEPGRIVLRDGVLMTGAPARVAEQKLPDGSVLIVSRDLSPLYDLRRTLLLSLLAATVLGGAAAWLVGRWAVNVGIRPITRFVEYAEAAAAAGSVTGADLPNPPHVPGRDDQDELARLERALTAMLASLRSSQERLHQLVADAGHELRTPLSSLRNNVALLRRAHRKEQPLPVEDEQRLLSDLEGQTIELSDLVDDLVQVTADHARTFVREPVRFDETIARAADRAQRRSREHELHLRLEPWVVEGDASALERAVVNLLDNAIKFSPPSTRVEVDLQQGTLTVTDEGAGIAPEQASQAFARFWRAPSARALPGSGLGLAMVAEVADFHDGQVRLEPRSTRGCVATLTIPGHSPELS